MRNFHLGVILVVVVAPGCGNGTSPMSGPCDLTNATPVVHSSLAGSDTWASGVHQVPSTLAIPVGATLTIAACSRVELGANVDLTVNGSLVVAGTSDGPVNFVSAAPPAVWGSLHVNPGGTADLSHATLTGGGGATAAASSGVIGAPIFVQGTGGPPPPRPLKVVSVDVEQATGVGVALVNAGFADGSTALVVHAAGTYPVYLGADVADTLPDGTYTGNGVDAIALQAAFAAAHGNTRPITRDVTFHNRGVPYCAGMKEPGEIVIGDISGANVPLVTLEPGVAIGFPKGQSAAGRINVLGDSSGPSTVALGALSAVGTSQSPIIFSSCEANAAPGDWIGITFVGVDPRTQLQFVGIGNAGANSGVVGVCTTVNNTGDGDAAVQIMFQKGAPAGEFITNSLITGSAGSGIYRGWGGGVDIDFLATNQLMGIAWCSQTLVPDMLNACPSTPCMTAP